MEEERQVSVLDGEECSQLDPQLWKELPQVLLGIVIAKLPFSKIVAFRRVCKLWYSDIIPHAAVHVEASSSRSALLYFDFYRNWRGPKGSPCWMQIWNYDLLQKFEQKCFPSPKPDEDIELIDSQGGLLFFGFKERKSQMVQNIVVCNPLTGKSKGLGLPQPMIFDRYLSGDPQFIVGVVFDSAKENYNLVTVGVDGAGQYIALLYNSCTRTWKNGTSMLPTILKAAASLPRGAFWSGRSVLCTGNLYWLLKRNTTADELYHLQYVLEFNSVTDQWRMVTVEINRSCLAYQETQMAAYNGAIGLWHLNGFSNVDVFKSELFDPNFVSRYPQSMICRCDFNLRIDPPINPMQHCIPQLIERVDGLHSIYKKRGVYCTKYLAFGDQNFVYHVLLLHKNHSSLSSRFTIVAHDTNANSYVELPKFDINRFPLEPFPPLNLYRFSISNIWSFSPSLTSLP